MRVHAAQTSGNRSVAKTSTVAVLGLACFVLGFVALNQWHTGTAVASMAHEASVTPVARRAALESQVLGRMLKVEETEVRAEAKFEQDLHNLVSESKGAEIVSRKELQEVSDKIATAVRASHNAMDVRHLQEIGSPKPCGPKRPPTTVRAGIRRPCIPRPSPTPPTGLGTCNLCVTYTYGFDPAALDACKPSNAAFAVLSLSTFLLSNFPVLDGQIGGDTPICEVKKVGQDSFSVNGPYCRGPVDPADYPAIEEKAAQAAADVYTKFAESKFATTSNTCTQPNTYATTETTVGQENQMLTVTLVCDDGQEQTTSFATACQ